MAKKAKLFRDPVHGMIEVFEDELSIIETPAFQRLRKIRQLGLTNHVYHGAEHTRFGHALGTMHVAGEIFDAVARERRLNDNEIPDADEKRRLVRLAALLHDIGHAPFSHTAEEALFPKDYKHEQLGADLIRSDHLAPTIRARYGQDFVDVVAAIIDSKRTIEDSWLATIVSGPIDADKCDYLLRDSLHCGVTYGHYDKARLLSKLVLRKAPSPEGDDEELQIVATVGGLQAAESVFVARYWLFVQIYYHPVRRQLDHMLGRFIFEEALGGKTYPVDDLEAYLAWDDNRVLRALAEGKGPWATRLKSPRPYYRVITEREPSASKRRWYKFVEEDVNKGAGEEVCFYDGPGVKTDPTHPLQGTLEFMVEPEEGKFEPIAKMSDFVGALAQQEDRKLYTPRIFALPDWEDRARTIYEEKARTMEER